MNHLRRVLAAFVVAAGISGCGEQQPKLVPVEGKVTLKDGTPIAFGYIILHPDASKGNPNKETSHGTIRAGSYAVQTRQYTGAPPGAYRVSIEAAKEVDENNPYFTEWLADEKYVNPDTSKLTLEAVEQPEPGRYDFQLDPHPPQKRPKKN